MVQTRSRSRTRTRARTNAEQGQAVVRRASSVPVGGRIFDCVLMMPRKRKRTSIYEESLPNGESEVQDSSRTARTQRRELKKLPARISRSQTRSVVGDRIIPSTPEPGPSSRSRTRATSSAHTPRRRAASTVRTSSEEHTTQARRPSARIRTVSTDVSRTPGASSRNSRRSRARDKGKGKGRAEPEDYDMATSISTSVSVGDSSGWDADSSMSGEPSQNAKRRRRHSPLRLSLSLDQADAAQDGEEDSQKTAVEADFHMLEGPDALPWIPVDPDSQDSEYVPPGLNALIEGTSSVRASRHASQNELTGIPCTSLTL
ncbi:hypothetical protein C8Q76DRAFT_711828 [Earliella scabrosa]|nr:hypothetical protein C8Q76DRAFT_711828 [Earliella scabrosa]